MSLAQAVKSIAKVMRRSSIPGVDALRGLSTAGAWLGEARSALERFATREAAFALEQASLALQTVACDLSRGSPELSLEASELSSAAVSLAEASQSYRGSLRSVNDR